MGLLGWIIIGFLAGAIAKAIVPGEEPAGIGANIIIGVLGAVVGGMIMNVIGGVGITGFNLYSLLVAVGGASLLLIGYHKLAHQSPPREE